MFSGGTEKEMSRMKWVNKQNSSDINKRQLSKTCSKKESCFFKGKKNTYMGKEDFCQ